MSFAPAMVSSSFAPLQTLTEHPSHPEDSSICLPQGDSGPQEIKPFTLPSLASITANLSTSINYSEPSLVGPHRNSYSLGISSRRRFSPLGTDLDYADPVSPLDSERSTSTFGERRPSLNGISMIATSGNRPRSRSLFLGHSLSVSGPDSDPPVDESASDSGGSDKKNEDNYSSALSKKRSRTLTTPSQQRRLMQILEQTRFPSTDVREQLARELGMTPRRVQIWFQNRRQGMKKAMEQKTEHETSVTPLADYHRSRGYSFGAYPTPTDLYSQSGLRPLTQTQFAPATMTALSTGISVPCNNATESTEVQQPSYTARPVSRGIPRSLPNLQLSNNYYATSNTESSSTVGEFLWSDPSTATSVYSMTTGADRDSVISPFTDVKQQSYPTADSTHSIDPSVTINRHRSCTNPDFFGMMNGLMTLSDLGQTPSESIYSLEHASGLSHQRFVDNDCDQSPRKHSWLGTYGESASAWHEGLSSFNNFSSNGDVHHPGITSNLLYTTSVEVPESTGAAYYCDRNPPAVLDTNPATLARLTQEGAYGPNIVNFGRESASGDIDEGSVSLAHGRLRQRSQSLQS